MKEVQLQIELPPNGKPARPLLQLLVDGELIGNVTDITLDDKLRSQPMVTATFIVRNIVPKRTSAGE